MTAHPTAQHVGPTTTRALHIFPQIAARRSTAGILVLVRATPMAWAWPGDSCAILHKHNIHCIWACEVAMLHMGQEPAPLATNDLGSVRHATACMQADQAQVITKSARSPTSSQSTPPAPSPVPPRIEVHYGPIHISPATESQRPSTEHTDCKATKPSTNCGLSNPR